VIGCPDATQPGQLDAGFAGLDAWIHGCADAALAAEPGCAETKSKSISGEPGWRGRKARSTVSSRMQEKREILAFHPLSKTGFALLPSLELVSLLCHYKAGANCSIAIREVLICKKNKEYTSFHFYPAVFSLCP
jgi:hypothetical protein